MVEVRGIEPRSLGYNVSMTTCLVCLLKIRPDHSGKQDQARLAFKGLIPPAKATGETSLLVSFCKSAGATCKRAAVN